MTNTILASSIQIGDTIQYRTGDFFNPKDRYFMVSNIKTLGNGVIRLVLGRRGAKNYRHMDVRKNQEVRIKI